MKLALPEVHDEAHSVEVTNINWNKNTFHSCYVEGLVPTRDVVESNTGDTARNYVGSEHLK